jgi:uncharacterized membrane protein
MRKLITAIIIVLLSAAVGYWLAIIATPYVVLLKVKSGAQSSFNQPVYADLITDKDRHVVMPNPDFLYVVCGYDIRKSPVRITGMMPDSNYCSVALYSANTRNFYIRNDRQTPGKQVDFLLVKKGDEAKYAGTLDEIVVSPSSIGVMLVRILVRDTSEVEYLKGMQRSWKVN